MSAGAKSKYDDMAKEDKDRYAKEMADYVPEDGGDDAASPPKKKKAKKDPNAPKRGMTAYLYFANELRPKLKASSPDLSFSELNKKIGEKYKELTSEQREKYEALARKDKERYSNEKKAYKATPNPEDDDDNDEDSD